MKIEFPFRMLTSVACVLISGMWLSKASVADSVVFGSGVNQFNMEFVQILQANNADDTTGNPNPAGSVAYEYNMGKFEVSENMITKYNSNFGTANNLAITKDTRGVDKPATSVSWNEAARFVNWLNTSTGGFAAYKFTTTGVNDNIALWTAADPLDYNASNPYRSLRTNFVLPSMDEWYKAAYFDPNTGIYFDFPNGSNTAPVAVASGTAANTAVYSQPSSPADIMSAGGLSPYGIMGLGGNVVEWEETAVLLDNSSGSFDRGARGGFWFNNSVELSSLSRFGSGPINGDTYLGFRVASLTVVPEPSSWVLTLIGIAGLLYRRRLRK